MNILDVIASKGKGNTYIAALAVYSCHNRNVRAVKECINCKLDEELVCEFSDSAANPRTEMVETSNAAVEFSAVMGTIRLPILADVAPKRESIIATDEDAFGGILIEPRWHGHQALQSFGAVQIDLLVVRVVFAPSWRL
jgi:hypothetical protein